MSASQSIGSEVDATSRRAIVERWFTRAVESYPEEMHAFLRNNEDPFRNPAGRTLFENLQALVGEVLGRMDSDAVGSALDAIMRLRAVQDFSPADAVRFVFGLRTVMSEICGKAPDLVHSRIDELALMAFNHYMTCREEIFSLQAKEIRLRAHWQRMAEGAQ